MTPQSRRHDAGHAEAGFTLVEALVAFFIVALTLTLGMHVLADGAGWARRGPAQAAHIEEALSVMNGMVADPRLAPGDMEGVFRDGTRWHVAVTDVSAPVSGQPKPRLLRLALFLGRAGGRPLFVTIANGPGA